MDFHDILPILRQLRLPRRHVAAAVTVALHVEPLGGSHHRLGIGQVAAPGAALAKTILWI